MKILVIPDLHGNPSWKEPIKKEYDKIVFLGDYCDSFMYSDHDIYDNLKDIIEFKKANKEKVVLLLGNHDLQYYFALDSRLVEITKCTGRRLSMQYALYTLFNDNKNLFKVAYEYKKHLFTHAGIVDRHFKTYERFWNKEKHTLEEFLEELFKAKFEKLFDISHFRGGSAQNGGIFWAHKTETIDDPLMGYHQIVGHTKVPYLTKVELINMDTTVVYTDCLENSKKFYTLNI